MADVYAYVDENDVVHMSPVQVDARYFLFRRTNQKLEPPAGPGTTEDMGVTQRVVTELPAHVAKTRYGPLIEQVAREHDVDAALIHAVISVESGFNPQARSPKGAAGLMQLMPATAARYGVADVSNPLENLRGGTRYLRDLLILFKNNMSLALAAYNAGEGAVIAAGHNIPPYRETRSYVPKVMQLWEQLRAHVGDRAK